MNNNDFSNESKAQFVLSTELLYLLKWLLDHDTGRIHKIITKALAAGLHQEISNAQQTMTKDEQIEEVHQNVIEFFIMLEALLADSMKQITREKAKVQNILPAADHIDLTICDRSTVRHSLEKATSTIDESPSKVQEIFYEEILRQWNPSKKSTCN